jgi:SAM-dependent methyltransferase
MDFIELGHIFARYEAAELNRTIHPSDDMWSSGPDWYWSLGRSGVECVLHSLSVTSLPRIGSILDLACNYGRTGRHLRAAFPESTIWFCDIHEGAEFCAREFCGEAIIAGPELTEVPLPHVDVMWVGSLFTHITESKTRSWLAYLAEHLNDHGILVATFHGRRSFEIFKTQFPDLVNQTWPVAETSGWGYVPYDDAEPDWGFSMNTVVKLVEIAEAVPGVRIGGLVEAGWDGNHDVLTLLRV